MRAYIRDDVSDGDLARNIAASGRGESGATANFLADIAEFDARKLYLPAGHPSMHSYLVHVLNQSDDAAYKRIQVARKAREFPTLFEALADGRLHLVGARLLAPYLNSANVSELLASAAHKTCHQIEEMLAQRFPRTEAMPLVMAAPSATKAGNAGGRVQEVSCQLATRQVQSTSKVAPTAPERFTMQLSMGRRLRDKLQYAQELASHMVAPGDYEGLLERMADAFIAQQEKRKFAATDKPRRATRPATTARTIPAAVRRDVWKRDGGQCTYCNDNGQRCPARTRIEYDHIVPVARGGESTVENIRLRCRAHNQFAAECEFGAEFMESKRQEARKAAETRRAAAETERVIEAEDTDVVPWLRALGLRAGQARELAEACDDMPDAPLEERIRRALSHHGASLAYRGQMAASRGT